MGSYQWRYDYLVNCQGEVLEKVCNTLDCDLDRKNIYLIRPINLVVQVKAISPFDKDKTQLVRVKYISTLFNRT